MSLGRSCGVMGVLGGLLSVSSASRFRGSMFTVWGLGFRGFGFRVCSEPQKVGTWTE